MPDSLITKRALASSLKELMKAQPLTKISVGDICEKCGMNRKSFYYHFCDKYDLVNWIFDTEFSEIRNRPDHIANFEDICEYFYSDREFYRSALQITGTRSGTISACRFTRCSRSLSAIFLTAKRTRNFS